MTTRRGTKPIDLRFPGVGRIVRASGTSNTRTYGMLVAMLRTLYDRGRLDLLRAVKEGTLRPLEVWEHYRHGQLERVPSPDAMKRLAPTAKRWVTRYKGRKGEGIHDGHRRELKAKLERLIGLGGKDATLADLPRLLAAFRKEAEADAIHRTFNYAKAAVLAFLRAEVGRSSPLYQQAAAVDTLTVHRREGHPQAPGGALAVAIALGPDLGAIWWTMCATGMGPDELWEAKWVVRDTVIEIHGTKRARRHRVVPRLCTPERPAVSYGYFRKRLADATAETGRLVPYDGRRSFAHWMELAKVDRSRRKAYMGHALDDVLSLYEDHKPTAYLLADRSALLRLVLGSLDMSHNTVELPTSFGVGQLLDSVADGPSGIRTQDLRIMSLSPRNVKTGPDATKPANQAHATQSEPVNSGQECQDTTGPATRILDISQDMPNAEYPGIPLGNVVAGIEHLARVVREATR